MQVDTPQSAKIVMWRGKKLESIDSTCAVLKEKTAEHVGNRNSRFSVGRPRHEVSTITAWKPPTMGNERANKRQNNAQQHGGSEGFSPESIIQDSGEEEEEENTNRDDTKKEAYSTTQVRNENRCKNLSKAKEKENLPKTKEKRKKKKKSAPEGRRVVTSTKRVKLVSAPLLSHSKISAAGKEHQQGGHRNVDIGIESYFASKK